MEYSMNMFMILLRGHLHTYYFECQVEIHLLSIDSYVFILNQKNTGQQQNFQTRKKTQKCCSRSQNE